MVDANNKADLVRHIAEQSQGYDLAGMSAQGDEEAGVPCVALGRIQCTQGTGRDDEPEDVDYVWVYGTEGRFQNGKIDSPDEHYEKKGGIMPIRRRRVHVLWFVRAR